MSEQIALGHAAENGTASGPAPAPRLRDLADGQSIDLIFAVRVAGRFSVHPQYGKQIKLDSVRPAEPHEYNPDELADAPQVPLERLGADLRSLLETIQNPSLRELLDGFFGEGSEVWERFREAPAAKYYHQAYRGGLLEHALSVAQAGSAAAAFFPGIDLDDPQLHEAWKGRQHPNLEYKVMKAENMPFADV